MIWIAIAACFFIGFLFSGIEGGILAVNRVHLRHHARLGDRPARQLDDMLGNLERLMISVLIVTNTVTIVAVALLFGKYAASRGIWAGILAVLIGAPLFVFAMEFLPKAIFRRFPYRALAPLAKILGAVHLFLRPLVFAGVWLSSLLLRHRTGHSSRVVSSEDIRRQISERHALGEVSATERDMIHHVLDFRRIPLLQVMVPLSEVTVISPEMPVAEVLELSRKTDLERFPVQDANGDIQGLLQVYDLLIDGINTGRVQSYVRRMVSVPLASDPYTVLQSLRTARMTLAMVVTPAGRPAGIVSTEDLVRRLLLAGDLRKA